MNKLLTKIGIFLLLSFNAVGVTHAALIPLEAISAGYVDPGYNPGGGAQLWVDSIDYSLNQRGFNMVIIDQNLGTIIDSVNFDTHGSASEAENMATYINAIETGNLVLSAVMDSGALNMTPNAINALTTLGVAGYPLSFRSSWAFIGTKGAATGSAIESFASSGSGPVSVSSTLDVASVPAPAALWLLGSGLIGLLGVRKKPKLSVKYA